MAAGECGGGGEREVFGERNPRSDSSFEGSGDEDKRRGTKCFGDPGYDQETQSGQGRTRRRSGLTQKTLRWRPWREMSLEGMQVQVSSGSSKGGGGSKCLVKWEAGEGVPSNGRIFATDRG